jgi:hypothetical protein
MSRGFPGRGAFIPSNPRRGRRCSLYAASERSDLLRRGCYVLDTRGRRPGSSPRAQRLEHPPGRVAVAETPGRPGCRWPGGRARHRALGTGRRVPDARRGRADAPPGRAARRGPARGRPPAMRRDQGRGSRTGTHRKAASPRAGRAAAEREKPRSSQNKARGPHESRDVTSVPLERGTRTGTPRGTCGPLCAVPSGRRRTPR